MAGIIVKMGHPTGKPRAINTAVKLGSRGKDPFLAFAKKGGRPISTKAKTMKSC